MVTVKIVFRFGDILTLGQFDLGTFNTINQVCPLRLDCKQMFSKDKMPDRNGRNGEDRMHVLADHLSCYELLIAEETIAVIQEVEGHSIFLNQGGFAPNHFLPLYLSVKSKLIKKVINPVISYWLSYRSMVSCIHPLPWASDQYGLPQTCS